MHCSYITINVLHNVYDLKQKLGFMLKMRKNAWSEGEKNNTPNYYGKRRKINSTISLAH